MYKILVAHDEQPDWHDLGEGPRKNYHSALRFAATEVGVPWIIVDDRNRPVAYGDSRNVVWSRLNPQQCPKREATKFFFIDVQYNNARKPDRFDWADSREGPFDSAEEAIQFAKFQCGLPWRVIDEEFEDNRIEYDAGNEDQPSAAPPACPECKTNNCEPGGGKWWCIDCGMEF